ncbi:conserved hypothetical protein [Verticillium alfalfae VaMs.102]|uniref:2-dehydropantoate 2-reductase n=1 Tax=Verticillium alfalfae (strain VaMs.102 / ATCC MYA-4576 / FGSC 10136) TaxID=526221 RepID=C9SBD1_VERA1|nr:conserved hypothetical protein [Verticillium alfalfae VaMs.102]EEY15665.1 conserved hypothetical protein [Verticillium alfalfae VaMs.102]
MEDFELTVCVVGGNPVSAFLSWRLQASNACDVTLVWKSGYEHVAQYGLTFKSSTFGNERFKPRHVVRAPEDAAGQRDGAYDYVILCVKALPDVYDLAAVIDAVVTPQHTCILVNTTHTLGVEAAIEERFPTNVVLSLVSNAELSQLGQSEFEHKDSTEGKWIARFLPPFGNNNRAGDWLLEKTGVRDLVSEVLNEMLALASAHGCNLDPSFKQKTIDDMTQPTTTESIMWQDFMAKRPMEVETYLGSPMKLAKDAGVPVPRIETLYAVMHNLNIVNRQRPKIEAPMGPSSPNAPSLPRMSSQISMNGGMRPMPPNGMSNGNGMPPRGPRPRNSSNLGPGPGMRRGPPSVNGGGPPNGYGGRPSMNGPPNGYPGPGSRAASRRGSMEANDLEEFSHLVLYDDIPEGGEPGYGQEGGDVGIRERELELRQRELALREQEMRMGRGRRGPPPPRRGPHPMRHSAQPSAHGGFDDDDDDDDYFDPTNAPITPMADPDNFDMMSVTSWKEPES